MENNDFQKILDEVIFALKSAGYDPYEQITGYLQTGNDLFITRAGNAREKIERLDKSELKHYLDNMQG